MKLTKTVNDGVSLVSMLIAEIWTFQYFLSDIKFCSVRLFASVRGSFR